MSYQVLAPMAGTIFKVECSEGDAVTETSVLLIIESMKMEVPVEAMFAGSVRRVLCAEGDLVDQDQVLIELG